MLHNIHLLIIDPQNDFCDLPEAHRPLDALLGTRLAPALPVAGAHADMLRLSRLIREGGNGISGITVTLDSHHRLDIAHPGFWLVGDGVGDGVGAAAADGLAHGGAPAPFTPITAAQVRSGEFRPRDPAALPRALAYLDDLQARGRYTLMVWPVHCEIGSWGHNVHAEVRAAYNAWEERQLRVVNKVFKGSNPWTEHYSAVLAEVPASDDPGTQLNTRLIEQLARAELLLIAGQASSHCVRATTEDLVAQLPAGFTQRLVLLTDCMSPVAGFEAQQAQFFAAMSDCGVALASSAKMLPRLLENAAA